MHGPRGVILVRAGKAEIGEHAVAHEFGDEAVVARDHAGNGVLVGADDPPHVLGIEPRRKRGRADEVGEHHGELPALGGVGRLCGAGAGPVGFATASVAPRPAIALRRRLRSTELQPELA